MRNFLRTLFILGVILLITTGVSLAYSLEVGIPGQAAPKNNVTFPEYLQLIYKFAMWGVGLAALVMLIWAGMQWIVSGLPDMKADAMEQIKAALMGLGLVLLSVLILQTINPQLIKTELPPVTPPKGKPAELSVSLPPRYGCMDMSSGQAIGDTSELPISCPAPQIMRAYIWNSSKNCFERSDKTGCEAIRGISSAPSQPEKVYGCRDNNDKIIGKASRNTIFCPSGQTMIGIPWDASINCYTRPLRNECVEVAIGN